MMRRAGTQSAAKVVAVSSLTVLSLSCGGGGGGSSSPTAAPLPSCQTNNTASVKFGNTSGNETMKVIVGGTLIATLAPGDTKSQTFTAGSYGVQFINRYTGKRSCTDTTQTWSACGNYGLNCKGGSGGGGGAGGGTTYGTGSAGTASQCHAAGLGVCTYGAGSFCAPYGTICCGYRNYCPLFNGVVLGTAWNCRYPAPDLPWACYERTSLNGYISSYCLNAKSYSCDQTPK